MPVTTEPTRKVVFRAAEGAGFSDKDAVKYGRFLERKVGLGKRPVAPEEIVDAARPVSSPIHAAFEWNDTRAAHEYRITQARHLVSHIVVTAPLPDGTTTQVRAFLNVTQTNGETTRGYVSEAVVWQDSELAEQVVGRALGELQGWRQRYATYAELAGIVARVDEILEAAT